ncbi:PBSX family phage terminase large subunit [Clostridium cadaveris]|uniref:PBSX family phage terminase large subunit n=1 Tax=Clostridium cadaveris TaxID=1529 RepID=UPI0025A38667|nr:PBSX family phage terminase large subunit [Clostridium cadaveris]MDM8310822.1 PBSX family phage terminase large subunit [Clostridium cadaveris]
MVIEKEVNPRFEDFIFDWNYKTYFLVGGYGSSKSYHIATKLILKLLEEKRTALVVREVYDTIRDSCYSLLEEIIIDLGLDERVRCVTSPMQIRFPNGSKIIFKGMDKPAKLKSINNVSLIWIEECSEVKYAGFKELLGRLRHPTLKLHMILSTNPVSKSNWCYKHFFMDKKNKVFVLDDKRLYKEKIVMIKDTYYHHSTADDNLFLPVSYIEQLEELKVYDEDLYRVARKGQFGTNGTKVLPQFEVKKHYEVLEAIDNIKNKVCRVGMDFGFEDSYNAIVRMAIDDDEKILYIYWEYYKNKMTDDKTAKEIRELKETKELIRADCAEPKTIKFYQQEGFRMIGAKKFPGSRLQNTKKVKRFRKIICSENCTNTIYELEELTYKVDNDGEIIPDEFTIDPHTFSAIWYGLDGYEVADIKNKGYSKNVYEQGRDIKKSNSKTYKGKKVVF